jgi:ABC-type transporter Mla subunit MlaD
VLRKLDELSKEMNDWKDTNNQVLRRLENAINTISRSIGTISQTVTQIQRDVAKNGGNPSSVEETLRTLTAELKRLESALKEHMSGHVGVLSESLVGRGGFWTGIWLVIGVQAVGWVVYVFYHNRQDTGKKLL